jgi:predicted ATPase
VFLTGEAGIGKSTLAAAFLERTSKESLSSATGQCVEQYGAGEPYLPLLEAVGRLCRKKPHWREAFWRCAPSWLLHLPALVKDEDLPSLERRTRGATQARMLRELAEAVEEATQEEPKTADPNGTLRYLLQTVDFVYGRPDVTADEIEAQVLAGCLVNDDGRAVLYLPDP